MQYDTKYIVPGRDDTYVLQDRAFAAAQRSCHQIRRHMKIQSSTVSDDATQLQIRDRSSSIRLAREQLTRFGIMKSSGYLAMSGKIINASITAALRQRNPFEEKAELNEGCISHAWQADRAKLARKDHDTGWTLKGEKARKDIQDRMKAVAMIAILMFSYKNHVRIDSARRFIHAFPVTSSATLDAVQLPTISIMPNTASDVSTDMSCRSKGNENILPTTTACGPKIHFYRQPTQELTRPDVRSDRARSKVRTRVVMVSLPNRNVSAA